MAWLHFSRTARNLALSAASTWYLGEYGRSMVDVREVLLLLLLVMVIVLFLGGSGLVSEVDDV